MSNDNSNQPVIFLFNPDPANCVTMRVRVVTIDDELWFVAKDVCAAINLTTEQVRRLDDDEKGLHTTQTHGGIQRVRVVNESGLYSLIMSSRKPEAKAFKKWVTSIVLPSIRKHGGYTMGQEKVATGEMTPEELMAKALIAAQAVIEKSKQELAVASQKLLEVEPKVRLAEQFLDTLIVSDLTPCNPLIRKRIHEPPL